MNLAIALTAIRKGATCLNQVEVLNILKKKIKTGELRLLFFFKLFTKPSLKCYNGASIILFPSSFVIPYTQHPLSAYLIQI